MAKKLRKSAKVTAADRIRFHLPTPPEGFQGNEEISELFAPTLAALDKRIEKESELHSSDEMTTDVLMRGPHPDGGFVAVLYSHNFNPFTWIKEKYQNRGGGPEERDYLKKLQRKQELDRRRAILIARGNARNKVAAIKVTEQEYRRAGINPGKKVKVRTEHEFYGEKTFKALKPQTEYEVGQHSPYNERSRKVTNTSVKAAIAVALKAERAKQFQTAYSLTPSGELEAATGNLFLKNVSIAGKTPTTAQIAEVGDEKPEKVQAHIVSAVKKGYMQPATSVVSSVSAPSSISVAPSAPSISYQPAHTPSTSEEKAAAVRAKYKGVSSKQATKEWIQTHPTEAAQLKAKYNLA